jgi:hypothetical protein
MTILTTNYLHYPTYSLGVISKGRLCGKKRGCSEGAFLRRATMELCMTMGLINREALATMVSVLSSLGTVHGILSNGIADEPTIFYSDRSKDDDDNLDTKVAPCALNIGQPSHNASNLKTPSIPSNLTAKRGDDHISKDQDDASDTPNPEAPGAYESALPTEPQLAARAIDDNRHWEVHEIIGKEDIGGVLHYLVNWSPTLEPEHSLGHAKESVDKFEARLRAKRGDKNKRGRLGLKRAVIEADESSSQQQKKLRGRPQKQT